PFLALWLSNSILIHDSFHRGPIPRRTSRRSPRRAQRRAQSNQREPTGRIRGGDAIRNDWLVRPAGHVSGGLWRESQSAAAADCPRLAEVRHGAAFPLLLRSSHSLHLVHQRIQEEWQEARHG